MGKMSNLWQKFLHKIFEYAPSVVACLCFLPCGLVTGYTICAFVAERNIHVGLIAYGPLILGAGISLIVALSMLTLKFMRSRLIFWQPLLLLVGGIFHLIASCFFFGKDFDYVGAFIAYVGHSISFVAGFSFLQSMCSKMSRALFLSSCCSFYLLGLATAVSLIHAAYEKNLRDYPGQQLTDGIYINFAATYLCVAAVLLALHISLKVLNFLGHVDVANSRDDELRIANLNGTVFDKRQEIIKRTQFFYVTKNQQWNVLLVVLFTEAIQYALFIYFLFWFSLNTSMQLTEPGLIHIMVWMLFAGGVTGTISLRFFSVKINFVFSQLCLIVLTVLSLIICTSVQTKIPFCVLIFFFGLSHASLQVALIEVAHLRFTECAISVSYILKLLSTGLIYYYFVYDSKESFFYLTDKGTIMAHGFVFMIITALLAIVVAIKVPRTYRMSLLDIQKTVCGIIFLEHQIEQLNVAWLNEGKIPTISSSMEH
ncbi:uncharacterized protein LOC115629656 [Scaptodrosophila lebanonensis]|uniref:Uncharacterized protein LOC115629656 n=1 Tax=Drosophila lebanonensis TaxID=7225 RepID=A0A6J2U2B2_DROLE|nr:uncharacterized protein LOC115629656 [Scaptodrosophila lebanonensis]